MKIISHRGNGSTYKENTIKSILNALNYDYVDGVEFDVRMTKDYKFVINHDPFYKGYFIRKTSLKNLKSLGLDSLDELLCNINTNKILLIEIKEESLKFKILCAKIYRILKKYNLNYYIFSFNYDLMKYFQEKYPFFKLGLLIGIKKNLNKIKNNFDFVAINYKHTDFCFDKEVFVWTVNSPLELKKVKSGWNVITDKPKYVYNLEKKL